MRLVSSWWAGIIPILFALALAIIGGILTVIGYWSGWIICLCAGLTIVFVIVGSYSRASVLVLTQGGFSLIHRGDTVSYRWSDIGTFSVTGGFLSRIVVFNLSAAGEQRVFGRGRFPSNTNAGVSEEHRELPDDYGLGVKGLNALMTQWQDQYTERRRR